MNTLFTLNLKLSDEYSAWINELIKVVSVQLVSHILHSYVNTGFDNLFNNNWIQGLLFMLIAFTVYHLIIKKTIKVQKSKNENFIGCGCA